MTTIRSDIRMLLAMSTLAASAVSTATYAQSEGSPLEEIVVTATKRAESLFEAPISVSALSRQSMEDQGIRDIGDIALAVPGLRMDDRSSFGSGIAIRGISSTTGASTTGVYIDDVPVAVRGGVDASMQPIYAGIFDVDRVEVLRGPQGTLYGAGSQGGTVRFIMTQPSLRDYSMFSRVEAASTSKGDPSYELGVAGGGPLIEDVLGFRASVWGRQNGGWLDRRSNTEFTDGRVLNDNTNSSDIESARLALLWQPAEGVTVSPSFFYQDDRVDDTSMYWERSGPYVTEGALKQPTRSKSKIAANTITWDAGSVEVTSVTSYLDAEGSSRSDVSLNDARILSIFGRLTQDILAEDPASGLQPYDPPTLGELLAAFPDYFGAYDASSHMRQWSQEIRLTSTNSDARVSWVGGLYWQDTRVSSRGSELQPLLFPLAQFAMGPQPNVDFWLPTPMLAGDLSYDQRVRNDDKQIAAFADVTVRVTDRLKVTGGLRVSQTEFEFESAQDGPWVGFSVVGGGKQKETPVTPKVNVTYEIDRGTLYATVAKGYRIGGANPSTAAISPCQAEVEQRFGPGGDNPATFDSDTVWSYEIGAKKSGIADRLDVAASVFRIKWSDIQTNVTLDCAFNYSANLGTAVSQGFDLSVNALATDNLKVGADLGYVDAHVTANSYSFGGSTPSGPDDSLLAKNGDPLGGPEWTAHIYADYRWPFSKGDGYVRGDYSYQEPYWIDPRSAEIPGSDKVLLGKTDPFHLVSARLGFRARSWDISLFADNLFNSDAVLSRREAAQIISARGPRPRTLGVTLTYSMK